MRFAALRFPAADRLRLPDARDLHATLRRLVSPRRLAGIVAVGFLVSWPWLPLPSSYLGNANTAGLYFLPALSLVMLTGWVGQVSLAQASFVGVGAYLTAMATRDWGLGFPLNLPVGALAAAGAAAILGLVALRVRGLYLAVATLIFAWAADAYLFTASWMGGIGGSTSAEVPEVGTVDVMPYFDWTDRRTFYYVVLAACALALFTVLNLRDSRVGRSFFAVRGSEIAAASFGVDVVRAKLVAFAVSGFIAGIAGSLLIVHQGAVVSDQFNLTSSLFYLSIAVVGGLASIGGALAASLLFAALNELFFRVEALAGYLDVVSAALLAVVLLVYPGGLAALGQMIRSRTLRLLEGLRDTEHSPQPADAVDESDQAVPGVEGRDPGEELVAALVVDEDGFELDQSGRRKTPPVVTATGITVQFGGLTAVDDVSLEVRRGEITGLIGPNGAGKTTFFNAISGLNRPQAGVVTINGDEATGRSVHERAAMGLARTFQVLQLFPQLTVFDNLMVGTHLRGRSSFLSHLVLTRGVIVSELEAAQRVRDIVAMLELDEVAYRPIAGLPFGVLRMVELARAIVTGAPVVMLDEPASGLDNVETDRLSTILRRIRDTEDVSLLVIEHDVRMVTALCDYLYVLDQGKLIAEGTASQIQRDEAVIAAYLGKAAEPVGVGV